MNRPEEVPGLGFINYIWPELGVRVMAEDYTTEGHARLSFFANNGTGEVMLDRNNVNLLSAGGKNTQAKRLEKYRDDISWDDALTWLAQLTVDSAAQGEPPVPIGKKHENMKLEYQLSPILEKNQPTTLYSPGGFFKSYLAEYIACLVQFNHTGLAHSRGCWVPTPGNVLYLDWESSKEDHERRVWALKQGLGIDAEETFWYRFCQRPLAADILSIQRLVHDKNISLLIVDSQMAASGQGPDPSQVSTQFYNALRSLKCTTLTLDHVSKAEWGRLADADSLGPHGSVVKFNRSRSQFEIKKSQTPGDDYIEIALVHRKHNEGKLLKPIGIRIDFEHNADDELERVTLKACDISDNPDLSKVQTVKDRLISVLAGGSMSVTDLEQDLGKPAGTIRTYLNRYKDTFVKLGDEWGLRAYEE